MKEEFIWAQKYRPNKIEDLILEDHIKTKVERFIKDDRVPHLFLYGSPGLGKTTLAKVIVSGLGLENLFINASAESSIEMLREKVSHFARTVSFNRKQKIIIMDEIDGVTSNAFFPALRPILEQYSKNCTFIATANNPEQIPPAIISRFQEFEYEIEDKKLFAKSILERLELILQQEKTEYDKKIIIEIVKKFFPDIRKMINVVQNNQSFLTDNNVLKKITGMDVTKLIEYMKKCDFVNVRSFIENDLTNYDSAYKKIYDAMYDFIKKEHLPNAIEILNSHQYQNAFVVDKGINLMNMMIQISSQCEFI